MGTFIDIILTNLPSKYTSAVFNQDLSDHCLILWRTAIPSNSPRDMQLFREVKNQYTQSVRKAKASFFKQKFASCSTNCKKFWDT